MGLVAVIIYGLDLLVQFPYAVVRGCISDWEQTFRQLQIFPHLWRRKSRSKGKKGRHPLADDIVALIKSMARDNRTWGLEQMRGELLKLGVKVSKSTIQQYVNQLRQPLSPKQSWATFVRNHARDIWACDFLQTHALSFRAVFLFRCHRFESCGKWSASRSLTDPLAASARVQRFSDGWNPSLTRPLDSAPKGGYSG